MPPSRAVRLRSAAVNGRVAAGSATDFFGNGYFWGNIDSYA